MSFYHFCDQALMFYCTEHLICILLKTVQDQARMEQIQHSIRIKNYKKIWSKKCDFNKEHLSPVESILCM